MKLRRYVWGIIFFLLAIGAFMGLWSIFQLASQDWGVYNWFFLGMIAYLILMSFSKALFSQNFQFFRTFTHELTHTIFTVLSFKKIRAFQATSHQGGEVHVVGGGNMLILLSPYCIPIFTITFLLLRPLLQIQFWPYLEFVIGASYLFHLHTNWLQTGLRQTDINKYPYLASFSFILLFHFLLLGIIIQTFQEGLSAFWLFPKSIIVNLELLFMSLLSGL